jgi:hypothetical protein
VAEEEEEIEVILWAGGVPQRPAGGVMWSNSMLGLLTVVVWEKSGR